MQHQAEDWLDTDLPTALEAKLFCTTLGKLIWVMLMPVFYGLRPLVINPKKPGKYEHVNIAVQLTLDYAVWYFFGKIHDKLKFCGPIRLPANWLLLLKFWQKGCFCQVYEDTAAKLKLEISAIIINYHNKFRIYMI